MAGPPAGEEVEHDATLETGYRVSLIVTSSEGHGNCDADKQYVHMLDIASLVG
jgi:hypothetical protein